MRGSGEKPVEGEEFHGRERTDTDHAQWLDPATAKRKMAEVEPSGRVLEPHAVARACGHWETIRAARPWAYCDHVAALIPCSACRRKGVQGPIAMGGDAL